MTLDPARESAWRAAVTAVLKGASLASLTRHSRDGLPIEPLYPPADGVAPGPWRDPGRPFGILPRIEHPDGTAAAQFAAAELASGATGLVLTGAGATTAHGFGVPLDRFAEVLDAVRLDGAALHLEVPGGALPAAIDAVAAAARRQGCPPERLEIALGGDPLGEAARWGDPGPAGSAPLGDRVAEAARAMAERALAAGFGGRALVADGRVHAEAGASEAQELAAVLATGVAYMRALEPLDLDVARQAIGVTLVADADEALTLAKFRAARRLWARIEEACGLTPRPMRLHAETAWRMMARQDPHSNILRTTIASAAAILGGADSLTVRPLTSAIGLPDGFTRRLARNTPLILLEEAGLGRVEDPTAGAGGIEALTDALCRHAWRLFGELERQGGLAAALVAGTWQREVAAVAAARRADIAAGRAPLVGVTVFAPPAAAPPPVLLPRPAPAAPAPDCRLSPLVPAREAEPFERDEALPLGEASP